MKRLKGDVGSVAGSTISKTKSGGAQTIDIVPSTSNTGEKIYLPFAAKKHFSLALDDSKKVPQETENFVLSLEERRKRG